MEFQVRKAKYSLLLTEKNLRGGSQELEKLHLRLRYDQTLAFGCTKIPCLEAVGTRISISSLDFENSKLKVENVVKLLVFRVF